MKGKCEKANPDCKYYPNCYSDTHHLAFPRCNFRSKLERAYRNASRVQLCRREHDEVHANWCGRYPKKPTAQEMRKDDRGGEK